MVLVVVLLVFNQSNAHPSLFGNNCLILALMLEKLINSIKYSPSSFVLVKNQYPILFNASVVLFRNVISPKMLHVLFFLWIVFVVVCRV